MSVTCTGSCVDTCTLYNVFYVPPFNQTLKIPALCYSRFRTPLGGCPRWCCGGPPGQMLLGWCVAVRKWSLLPKRWALTEREVTWEVSLVSENLILFSEGYIRGIDLPSSFTNVHASTVLYFIECVYLLIKL